MSNAPRRIIKLTLAYDGTDFAGWQIQANARTVQGTVQGILERISGEPIVADGERTDRRRACMRLRRSRALKPHPPMPAMSFIAP